MTLVSIVGWGAWGLDDGTDFALKLSIPTKGIAFTQSKNSSDRSHLRNSGRWCQLLFVDFSGYSGFSEGYCGVDDIIKECGAPLISIFCVTASAFYKREERERRNDLLPNFRLTTNMGRDGSVSPMIHSPALFPFVVFVLTNCRIIVECLLHIGSIPRGTRQKPACRERVSQKNCPQFGIPFVGDLKPQ